MPIKGLDHGANFCCICREMVLVSGATFYAAYKKCYQLYFDCKVGDFDKSWDLDTCCISCVRVLTGWKNVTQDMPFTVMI